MKHLKKLLAAMLAALLCLSCAACGGKTGTEFQSAGPFPDYDGRAGASLHYLF